MTQIKIDKLNNKPDMMGLKTSTIVHTCKTFSKLKGTSERTPLIFKLFKHTTAWKAIMKFHLHLSFSSTLLPLKLKLHNV